MVSDFIWRPDQQVTLKCIHIQCIVLSTTKIYQVYCNRGGKKLESELFYFLNITPTVGVRVWQDLICQDTATGNNAK